MSKYEAIIFDMDGVIVDSEPRHRRAFLQVFDEMGYANNHGIIFEDYLGQSDRAVWEAFVDTHKPDQNINHLTQWKEQAFIKMLHAEQPIFNGVPELVDRLTPIGPLAVASGSVHLIIDEVLSLQGLRSKFHAVASIDDVTRTKPAPDIFLHAAELLCVSPEKICVIEDTLAGIQAAESAGMDVVAVTNTFPKEAVSHANFVSGCYEEIGDWILGQ
ncbi:HAD family phosphatase [Verrucomicrobia bacterium]|nr:HAD family phosphatase [Verrucomicrobiota bacterium]MDB4459168.1 HAD family phosphatase [bacterium]